MYCESLIQHMRGIGHVAVLKVASKATLGRQVRVLVSPLDQQLDKLKEVKSQLKTFKHEKHKKRVTKINQPLRIDCCRVCVSFL